MGVRRFACTQCGKCCNRPPEVELSEAASLADAFVFRLMFRLYALPGAPKAGEGAQLFYEKKRLLAAHAARKYLKRNRTHYLMISALALDTRPGACAMLSEGRCGIYARRPLACQAVPFHYARAGGLLESDLDAFVSTPGYACDTSERAPVVLDGGRLVDSAAIEARAEALRIAEHDRPWREAIVRRMKNDPELPTLDQVEANAGFAVVTTSMRVAWRIAADAGLMSREESRTATEAQLAAIERELASGSPADEDRTTLQEMRAEYRHALNPQP